MYVHHYKAPFGEPEEYLEIDGVTPLHMAVLANKLHEVKQEIECLKKQNKSLDSQIQSGETSLLLACKLSIDTNIVKLLVEEEADVNIFDDMKITPLHAACWTRKETVTGILLQAGAIVNAQDVVQDGSRRPHNTPLHYAVKVRSSNLTKLLLDAGADPNLKNDDAATPVCYITKHKFVNLSRSIIERLVASTTNLNITFENKYSLLERAIYANNIELAAILIEHGADVNFSTTDKSPAKLAAFGRLEIFQLIWEKVDIKKCNEDKELFNYLLRWSWDINPSRVEYFYQVMRTPGLIPHPEGRYFNFLVNNIISARLLQVNVYEITKLLLEKGAVFIQEDLEAFIYLCCKYHKYNCAEKGIELLNLFIDFHVNITSNIIYFSVVNHPNITLNLLQYCIMCDPIDIFKHFFKCKRKQDVSLLNLIKNILKLCSPNCGLQLMSYLQTQKNEDISVRSSSYDFNNKFEYPWYECVLDCQIDNDLRNEVLDLLYRHKVSLPTLVELSRDKIRQQLRLSCKDTKSYLQSLKSLELPRIYTDIIQCKANIINLN